MGSEVVPALGRERLAVVIHSACWTFGDVANDVGVLRDYDFPGNGEEEFVVFAAVEGVLERGAFRDGNVREVSGDVGCSAEPGEVHREAVAQVHGAFDAQFTELLAELELGLRNEAGTSVKGEGSFAQRAANADAIAGAGLGTEERLATRDLTADGDVAGYFGGVGEVAAGEDDDVLFGEFGETIEEGGDPLCGFIGKSEGKEAEERPGAHGGAVAERAGESFVADDLGVFVPGEVDAFVHHVGGENQVVGCIFLAEDGAIVANTRDDAVALRDAEALDAGMKGVDDLGFGQANIVGLCDRYCYCFVRRRHGLRTRPGCLIITCCRSPGRRSIVRLRRGHAIIRSAAGSGGTSLFCMDYGRSLSGVGRNFASRPRSWETR